MFSKNELFALFAASAFIFAICNCFLLYKRIKMIIVEKAVDKIVMGLPKNMDGSLGFQAEYVRRCRNCWLHKTALLHHFQR